MTDLPILATQDLSKVPQSTQESNTGVIAFNQLVPYFFRYNATYKANDVFIVDENLGLTPVEVVRDANSNYIPTDIKYTGATPTYTADGSNINFTAGRKQENKGLSDMGAGSANSLTTQAGGIAWVTNANGVFWANHPRAFDQGSSTAPVIVGTRRFPGTATESTYTNFYYLGASITDYPLYSSSMNYRAQGWRREGLTFSIDLTHGFLQTAAGLLSNWYEEDIKIPQNGKNSFYYAHREKILNSPAFAVSLADLDRKDVNGTLTALAANENAWHFVYLDPSTKLIYVVLWAGDTVAANSNYKSNSVVVDAHTKTIIPSFLRENGVLLGCIAVQQGQTFNQTYFCQLYQYQPGNGAALHPSVPSPSDALYGGTLKAKDNIYELKFDYDGYLINIAREVKNNTLFVYEESVPRDIALADFETTNTSLISMMGMGLMSYEQRTGSRAQFYTRYFSYFDNFNYPNSSERQLYQGNISYTKGDPFFDDFFGALARTTAVEYLPFDTGNPNNCYPVLRTNIPIIKQATDTVRFSSMAYSPKIAGLNNKTQTDDGIFLYNDTLRERRKAQGFNDSFIVVEAMISTPTFQWTAEYLSRFLSGPVIEITDLMLLVAAIPLAQQIKEMHELVKKAGLLADETKVVWPIIGYHVDNNSPNDTLEYALLGSSGIAYDRIAKNFSVTEYAPNFDFGIQPMEVACLASGDLKPYEALWFFLIIRYNFGAFLYSQADVGIPDARYQVIEIPLS